MCPDCVTCCITNTRLRHTLEIHFSLPKLSSAAFNFQYCFSLHQEFVFTSLFREVHGLLHFQDTSFEPFIGKETIQNGLQDFSRLFFKLVISLNEWDTRNVMRWEIKCFPLAPPGRIKLFLHEETYGNFRKVFQHSKTVIKDFCNLFIV